MNPLSSFEPNTSSNVTKHYNMKQFIIAAREYSKSRTEETAGVINRHLQLLSVTIDLSIFDPHTSIVSEFFVCLYELISSLEPRSSLAWCCVNVLSAACKNPAARDSLVHTYEFLPPISRLIGDHLTLERKVRLLILMQEISCGIKISWQIPHLPHLMKTLTKWIESKNDEIVTLSLGVLVNLCYKNLPAIYTLSRCVDLKKLIRTCMPMKGPKVEVHVCKLVIILDYMSGSIPEEAFMKLTEVTFKSVIEAFRAKDPLLLRHTVEFFLDVKKHNPNSEAITNYGAYDLEVERLLDILEGPLQGSEGDVQSQEPECVSLVFEFIYSLMEMKLTKLKRLHPKLLTVALKWIQTDLVCFQALSILKTIALQTEPFEGHTLKPLLNSMEIFLIALTPGDEEVPTHIEHNKRISALMQLLRALLQVEDTKTYVLCSLKEDHVLKIFYPLIGCLSPRLRANDADTYSIEAVNLYVNAVALVDQLAKTDAQWIHMYQNLLKYKEIHMILAQGLYNGPKSTKALILTMASSHLFPNQDIANAMSEMQPLVQMSEAKSLTITNYQLADGMCFPVMSVAQVERLEEVMNKLKDAIAQNSLGNVAMSDVMELYEYKLASMGHAERAATASLEAASKRCTHLQHRTAQLTAELSRLHQLLFHTQQCHEEACKSRDSLLENNKELNNKLEAERGRHKVSKSQLEKVQKTLSEKETELEETIRSLKETESARSNLEMQNNDLKKVVSKLEENLREKEKLLEKNNGELTKAHSRIEHYKLQLGQIEKQLKQTQCELQVKTDDLNKTMKVLQDKNQIIDTITKLTSSQHMKL